MRTMTGTRTMTTESCSAPSLSKTYHSEGLKSPSFPGGPVDLYQIPGDTGGNWRKERLVEFASRYPPSFDPVALGFLSSIGASKEDRTWWAFLYSTCYCIPTACALYRSLPLSGLEEIDLDEFWVEKKSSLVFQSDRKYVGIMNKFIPMVQDFISRTKGRPWEYMRSLMENSHEGRIYETLYKEVTGWFYFGRFGAILFIDTFRKCLGIRFEISSYDWSRGSTTTSGLYNAFYRDEDAILFDAGKKALSKSDKEWLDAKKNLVLKVLKKRFPKSHWDTISITRIFCTYRKLYKGTRYLGYYVDRQQEELKILERGFPEFSETWRLLWYLRKIGIDNEFLGELNGRQGIQKPLMKVFLEEGVIV